MSAPVNQRRAGAHAPAAAAVYNDSCWGDGDVILAGYLGGGVVELSIPAGCVHLRISELDAVAARIRAVAAGADPAGA